MSNSPLVCYKKISPNSYNPRSHKIDKITIHHMSGNLSIETCGNVFAPASRQASSNYGIGSDGRIGMYVEEKNAAWTSSSYSNDNRAVTIEVANDQCYGNWHVSDKALASLINLCVDICKRNGIKKLNYTGDASGNLTMHKWFAPTDCPGPYLESKFPYIANEVNKRLNGSSSSSSSTTTKPSTSTTTSDNSYKVKITADVLNVRKGAGTKYAIVTTVKKGEIYTIVSETSGWGKLKSNKGWINLGYTKLVPYQVKVTADALNVRKGAGTKYDVVKTVKKGKVCKIIAKKSNWGQLEDKSGWICLDYTKKV